VVRPRLEAFAEEMLGSLARRDQRAKDELYLRGLMLDGKRKSVQPMAERLGVGPCAGPVVGPTAWPCVALPGGNPPGEDGCQPEYCAGDGAPSVVFRQYRRWKEFG
jgi:hypothetical protein